MKTLNKVTLITLSLLATSAANASGTYIRNGNVYTHEGDWIVEAGYAFTSELYKEQKHVDTLLLNFGYHGDNFNADFGSLNYRFFGQTGDMINVNAYLGSSGLAYDSDSAGILKGMDKRKLGVDAGLNADIFLNRDGAFSVFYQHDISNASKGFQAGVKYTQVVKLGNVDFVPFAGVSYQSADFANYYFGVKTNEVAAQRKSYDVSGDFSYTLGYKLVVPLSKRWDVTQTSAYTRLGSEIANSPLVDSANQWFTGATISFHF